MEFVGFPGNGLERQAVQLHVSFANQIAWMFLWLALTVSANAGLGMVLRGATGSPSEGYLRHLYRRRISLGR